MKRSTPQTGEQDVGAYLRTRRAEIDQALEFFLSKTPDRPPLIAEAMRYSLFAGGKRLRPILAFATADTIGSVGEGDRIMLVNPAACAVEMIHTYSLIHDDLPAMDNDNLRRGRATSHRVYGDGIAILAGDGLLTEAFQVIARWPHTHDPAVINRKLRTTERLAVAAGPIGMVGGQAIDLEASGRLPSRQRTFLNRDELRAMHQRKTGALIQAAAVAGAIMVGASDIEIDAVDAFAGHLGLGFQIIDDILDVEGVPDTLGKSTGKDAAIGKPTYPAVFGLKESRELAAQAIADAKATLRAAGLGGPLYAIADWVLNRTH